jgi:putative ABC transport system substrate-binding protein
MRICSRREGLQLRRREFIGLVGGGAAWPLAAMAQQPALPVVGFLNFWASPDPNAALLRAFRRGLVETTGYVEGQNVAIEYRGANGQSARLPALAAELVRRQVAVIVAAQFSSPALAAKAATSTIPIVFMYGGDPVHDGLVASLNRPGGNVTGVAFINSQLGGKRLSLLRDLVPQARTVGILFSADPRFYEDQKAQMLEAVGALGLELVIVERAGRDYEAAFATLAERKVQALIVSANVFGNFEALIALSARHKIPTIYPNRNYVVAGGLMSYGGSFDGIWRQVGNYTGRILKGAQPTDLPVVRSTKFDLAINLKTAKALGLEMPKILLIQADEVIE